MSGTLPEALPPSFLDDEFPVDNKTCRLLGPTALVVQALMGAFVILSLVFKRHRESPKRPWRIWSFDVSKQVVGQLFVHGMNLLISGVVAHYDSTNPCTTYFLNILIDTTLGVCLIYFIHRFLTHAFSDMLKLKGFRSGQYGDPPSILYWIRQAAIYVTSLTTMKIIVVGLLAVWPGIFKMGDWLLAWTGGGDTVQVIFVMGLFPIVMNVLQFWLIDSIVKATSQDKDVEPSSSPRHSADREPLFNATGSDDEDEAHAPPRRFDVENPPLADSSCQSVRSKATISEEPKYSSSRASIDEPEEVDGMHIYPPTSNINRAHGFSLSLPTTPKHRPKRRPAPPALQLQRRKPNSPVFHAIAMSETPVTGRKSAQSASDQTFVCQL